MISSLNIWIYISVAKEKHGAVARPPMYPMARDNKEKVSRLMLLVGGSVGWDSEELRKIKP